MLPRDIWIRCVEYGLNEWKCYTSSNGQVFSVNIREEDLVRLRNNKLDSIIKDCVK